MRKVLYILGQLSDHDIEWMLQNGQRQHVAKDNVLIHEGQATAWIYIVLDGALDVTNRSSGSITKLGVGEMVGEMSFVDAAPPSATITADANTTVFAISRNKLNQKIEQDTGFAARFYRALAMFLADRLRGVNQADSGQDLSSDTLDDDELDLNILDNVYLAGQRFDRILKRMLEK